tara:strand:- start:796 stop:1668 length:873 start_codon:yes stop_codon:yes gene_type:complete
MTSSKLSMNIRGAIWMLGMVTSLSLLAVAARELSDQHGPYQLLVVRHSFSLVILLPFIFLYKPKILKTEKLFLHIFRNTSHFFATAGWIVAITMLPLAEVFAIEFTTPVWVAFFAVLFLNEKMNKGRTVSLLLGLIGILVILRPGFNVISFGSIIMVISAVGFAITNASTKALTRYDGLITILFWMSIIQLSLAIIPATLEWSPFLLHDLPWVILVGITGLSAHYSMTKAFQLADVSLVNPIDFLRLPLIAIVGYLLYSEKVDIFVGIGAFLIFAGNYYAIWREEKIKQF